MARFAFALIYMIAAVGQLAVANSLPNVVYTFQCTGTRFHMTCPDGGGPMVLLQSSDGNFYGVTHYSVTFANSAIAGGTVFKLTPAGLITILHQFAASSTSPSGSLPFALIDGGDGNLYGTTQSGGFNIAGVLFRVGKNGTGFQVLHRFCSQANCADGNFATSLAKGSDGNIYGVTIKGGSNNSICMSDNGCGTFFRVIPSTGRFTVLTVLDGSTAIGPSEVMLASDGNFYGTSSQNGTVFRVTTAGTFTVIFNFGLFQLFGVVQGANGNLYGVGQDIRGFHHNQLFEMGLDGSNEQTFAPVSFGIGTPISVSDRDLWTPYTDGMGSPGGVLELSLQDGTVEETFPFNGTAISFPSSLIQASSGELWGVASGGTASSGSTAAGAIFSLDAGLPPR